MGVASRFEQLLSRQAGSEAGDPFRGNVSQQQANAEQQHESRRAELDPAQQDCAAAIAARGYPAASPLADTAMIAIAETVIAVPSPIKSVAATPAQNRPLRQRKHQHQNCAGARPDADRQDGAQPARPAARTGKRARLRAVRMTAVLIVNVACMIVGMLIVSMMVVVVMDIARVSCAM